MEKWWSKDSLKLLLSGIVASCSAGLFWAYSGERAPQIIVTVVLVAFFLENRALKKTIANNKGIDQAVALQKQSEQK